LHVYEQLDTRMKSVIMEFIIEGSDQTLT